MMKIITALPFIRVGKCSRNYERLKIETRKIIRFGFKNRPLPGIIP
jgi:hypothetical protein